MDKRTEIQFEAIQAWVDNDKRGVAVIGTGIGKSRIGVLIAATQLENKKITSAAVIVPTTNLVEQWQDEFKKWGYSTDSIDFYCIQTAYKLNKAYDLVIVDEVHTTLSPKYREVYTKFKYKQFLGLTATLPEDLEYRQFLATIAPVVYTKSFNDVEGENVVSSYQVFNLPVVFTKSDRAKYNTFHKLFAEAQMELGILKKNNERFKDITIFDLAQTYSTTKNVLAGEERLVKYAKQFWSAMTMRKWVCYNSSKKIIAVKEIIDSFPNKKWIIFNKSIKMAELVARELGDKAVIYHSKMKDDERKLVLAAFKENKFQYLVAVDALNAGFDVPEVDAAICVSGVSTELVATQQVGRILRFRESKFAMFINFFTPDTVEERWIKKKNANLKSVWVNNIKQLNTWLTSQGKSTSKTISSREDLPYLSTMENI